MESDEEVPTSMEGKIPFWIKGSCLILPLWGIATLLLFWNGSVGWFDRGHWQELQEGAKTTFPDARE